MKLNFLLLQCLLTFSISAQSIMHVTLPETLHVKRDVDYNFIYTHEIKKGETLYSLSRSFKLKPNQLIPYNTKDIFFKLSPGDKVNVPVYGPVITFDKLEGSEPIYYKVAPNDNFFTLSRRMLNLEVEYLMKMNEMQEDNLQPGEFILIGYRQAGETVTEIKDKVYDVKVNDQNIIQESGVAYWKKDHWSNVQGRYVLHPTLPAGTSVWVNNPMYNVTLRAEVAGNIPHNTYPKEVSLIVSPYLAQQLGARDARFFVKLRYLRPES